MALALTAPARSGGTLRATVAVLLLVLLFVGTCAAVPPGAVAAPHRALAPSAGVRPAGNTTWPTPIRHVVVIVLENSVPFPIFERAPFQTYLAEHYAYAAHDYAVCHPSAPNYLALTSGAPYQCGSDGYATHPATNLGTLLERANLSWAGFDESMPTPCDTSNAYPYMVKHNPFLYYPDIVGNGTLCAQHDLPLTSWYGDVQSGNVPAFSFITPNMTDDGHDSSVPVADQWLRGFLGPELNASWMANSVVFVTYDEGDAFGSPDNSGYNGTSGGHVYLAAIGPWVRANYTYAQNSSHYDLLTTIEWLLGLGSTGHNDSAAFPPLKALFSFARPLSASIVAPEVVGTAPLTESFNATVTGGTPPYRYAWGFGDNASSNVSAPGHVFGTPGVYTVTLRVTDATNATGNASLTLVAGNASSTVRASILANRTRAAAPGAVSYELNASGGTAPYRVAWFFNDGTPPANGASTSHRFAAAGNYSVVAAVWDANGSLVGATTRTSIYAPLALNLLLSTPAITVGSTEHATAQVSGGSGSGFTYRWTLNGSAAGANSSSFQFAPKGGGKYALTVTVADPWNDSVQGSATFTAIGGSNPPPPPPAGNHTPPPAPPSRPPATDGAMRFLLVGVALVAAGAVAAWYVVRRSSGPSGP